MKKKLFWALSLLVLVFVFSAFVSCSDCEHEFGAYDQTKAPTCTEAGEKIAECTKCGEKDVIAVDALGHDGKWEITKADTCTEAGERRVDCIRCQTNVIETIPAAHVIFNETVGGTCTVGGEQVKYCSRCDYRVATPITATGHSWTAILEGIVPSCTIGSMQCENCGASQSPQNAADHSVLNEGDTCQKCGFQCLAVGGDGSKLMCHTSSGTKYAEYYGIYASNEFSSYNDITAAYISNEVQEGYMLPNSIRLAVFEENSRLNMLMYNTFENSNITSISIPASVERISGGSSFFAAFGNCASLKKVTFESGSKLKYIEDYAFYNCGALESVVIPSSIEKIGNGAFRGCYALESIKFENSGKVTSVGRQIFSHTAWWSAQPDNNTVYLGNICLGYKGIAPEDTPINIKSGTTVIADHAFENQKNVISLSIPSTVKYIGTEAFSGCSALATVSGGNNVEKIMTDAFSNTKWIKVSDSYENGIIYLGKVLYTAKKDAVPSELAIKDGIESIAAGAFQNCVSLTKVTVPSSVNSIGTLAFFGCTSLKGVNITDIAKWCRIEFDDNPLYYAGALYLNGDLVTDLIIPSEVTSISGSSFRGCTSLTCITIPTSVTEIGSFAFDNCTSLARVNITDLVKWCEIKFAMVESNPLNCGGALYLNGSLVTAVDIPNGVTSINYVFCGCTSITSVNIPSSVTSIGVNAFFDCTSLTSITIPSSVTGIGAHAFFGCTSLTSITIPSSVTGIGAHAFFGCTSLMSITIPSSVASIGESAFYGCSALASITIPENVTSIGENAFGSCTGLTEIIFNARNCADIKSSTIAKNGAFNSAGMYGSGISVSFGDGVTRIPAYLFVYQVGDYAPNITSVTVSGSVKSIGEYAFQKCDKLETVTFADDSQLESIGRSAFSDCKLLNGIIIPSSVTSISDYAFYNCKALETVTFESGSQLESIGANAFEYCDKLNSITVPASVNYIGTYAFYIDGLTSVTFEEPDGWSLTYENKIMATFDLSDAENNAEYLKSSRYGRYVWIRN